VLRVSLLGELSISDDLAGAVRLRSARALALVAFLVLHAGSPQPRSRIAGLFWPDSGDAQALTNLRRELHQLRQVLAGEPSLVVTSQDLCWQDTATCRVDVRVFDRERAAAVAAAADNDGEQTLAHASRAVGEYRGDLLPGVYEDWVLERRAELERQCTGLYDLLTQARVRRGDLPGAVDAARRRIQLQPLEETGYRTLMRLQAEAGDRAGAVSTYHHCASVLERELGVEPDVSTHQAFQRLIAPPPPPAVTPRRASSVASRAGAAVRPGAAGRRLLGRAGELAVLQEAWAAATAGHRGLVIVHGGAGVGKTRLVSEIAAIARQQGAVVASSQCFGTSGRLALAPVADWLRHDAIQAALARLPATWRDEVGRLLPADGSAGRGPGPRPMADAWQRHRFLEGLARALVAADRPTLLVLDNIHWCDLETLAFLTFCLQLTDGCPLLVAGTLRDDDPATDPEFEEWLVRMRATGMLTELSLSPLAAADAARLAEAVAERALRPTEADLLHATTGGFPLYVIEAIRTLATPDSVLLPDSDLQAVLSMRFQQASAPAREVAGLAAAVGTDFTLGLLTEASDLDADTVVQAVDELWQRRILRESGDGYGFAHDMLCEAAYARVRPAKRWLLHRRVAQGMELLHADDLDAVAAQLAHQYARGGRDAQAVDYYRRAADIAATRFGYAEAIRLHRQALAVIERLPPGPGRDTRELTILEALAAPLSARYGFTAPELQQTLERSVVLAESLGRRDAKVAAMVALWTTWFVMGRMADSYRLAVQALDLLGPDPGLAGPAHFVVGASAMSLGKYAEGLRHVEIVAKLVDSAVTLSVGTRADVHNLAFAAHAHWLVGHDREALAAAREAVARARAGGGPFNLAVALAYAGVTHQMRHDLPALREAVGELRELCDRYGFAYYREWGPILDGWSRPDEAGIALARRGIDNLRAQNAFARMPYWLSLLADLLARNGQPAAARASLDAALTAARAHDDLWWLPEVMRMRAAYDTEPETALARLRAAADLAAGHGSVALLRRCRDDLARPGVRPSASGVRPAG
jgi:DNA-binding SARP family transcriptional activator/tetratricopeptide (TPR) repeat protein